MNLRPVLSRRWRRRLSALLIGTATKLPPKLSPVVGRLRSLSADQTERAAKIVATVDGSPFSLAYHGFTMIELFPIELLAQVIAAGKAIVPTLDVADGLDSHHLGTMGLGVLYRTKPALAMLLPEEIRIFPDLPEWVDRIQLSLSRTYDATFIVSAEVVTTPQVDSLIAERFRTPVPAPIELNRLRNIGRLGFAYSQGSAAAAYATSIHDFLASLRGDIQRLIFRRYFPFGYFQSHQRTLPALELMEILGDTTPPANDWIEASIPWRSAIGLDFDRDYYSGNDIAIGIMRELAVASSPVWRVVFRPTFVAPRNLGRIPIAGRESAIAIQSRSRVTLHSIATMAHQGVVAALLSEFRRKVFLSSGRHRLFIPPQTSLYETISREWLLFDRSKRDLKSDRLSHDDDDFLKTMTYRTAFLPHAIDVKAAEVDMHDSAIWWYDQLTAGFSEIRSHFSDILATRSYGATFVLTAVAIFIAVLSFVVSVIALKGSAPANSPTIHSSGVPVHSRNPGSFATPGLVSTDRTVASVHPTVRAVPGRLSGARKASACSRIIGPSGECSDTMT